jgi:hypothetical protein
MAGAHTFLIELQAVLKALDDEALAALANKGLLRRARKDLELSDTRIAAVEADLVRCALRDAIAEIRLMPAQSTCSCPAPGICRHILAALVFLRDYPLVPFTGQTQCSRTAPTKTPAEVLADISDEQLQAWAGKPLLRKAYRLLAAKPEVRIEEAATLTVRFPARNIVCRWIPSDGLIGMVCSCQAEAICEHVVSAVLAYQVQLGKRTIDVEQTPLRQASGAPRSRAEILASVEGVLREMVALGLSRLSSATRQRLATLAVSAHGVDLPRLEMSLKSLAREIELVLNRDAQSSSTNILRIASRLEALRTALTHRESPHLVGQHRSQYYEVGQLTLTGLGARVWESRSGYQGLTLYFWDGHHSQWLTWTDTRPKDQTTFDPVQRFRAYGPWDGCSSPELASSSVIRLTGAWRNGTGRLSGRGRTRATVVEPSRPAEHATLTDEWPQLAQKTQRLFGGGLQENTENQDLVLLAPHRWGPAVYDSLRQHLTRPVYDAAGRAVQLWLPYTAENVGAVDLLESHDPRETSGLLGLLRMVSNEVSIQPISLFVGERIIHLNVPSKDLSTNLRKKRGPTKREDEATSDEAADDDEQNPAAALSSSSGLARLLATALAELESIAESGVGVRRNLDLLQAAQKRLDAVGVRVCSQSLLHFLAGAGSAQRGSEPETRGEAASRLLHAYYVLGLAAHQEALVAATKSLR